LLVHGRLALLQRFYTNFAHQAACRGTDIASNETQRGVHMKKLSALLMLMMLLGMVGCDNGDQPKPSKEPASPPPTVPTPQVK
jgi:hypothetical protein